MVQAGVIRLIAVPHEYSPVSLSSELHGGEQRQPWRGGTGTGHSSPEKTFGGYSV